MQHPPIKAAAIQRQTGMIGILISTLLGAFAAIAGASTAIKANMDAYHAPTNARIEVANQLMQSGLRYGNYLLNDLDQLAELIERYKNDPAVALECEVGKPLPDDLQPTKTILTLPTPEGDQYIAIRGVMAPYDCNEPLDEENFRLTFEILGSLGCTNNRDHSACTTRSVVLTAFEGDEYRPEKSPPPPQATAGQQQNGAARPARKKKRNNNSNTTSSQQGSARGADGDDKEGATGDGAQRNKVKRKNVGL